MLLPAPESCPPSPAPSSPPVQVPAVSSLPRLLHTTCRERIFLGTARVDAGRSKVGNSAHGSYRRGKEKVCDMGRGGHGWSQFRPRGHGGLMSPACAAMADRHCTFVSHLTDSPCQKKPSHAFCSWFPMCISTGAIQASSWCNAEGEFHPQGLWLGKIFINRKQTPVQPTR